MGMIEKGFNVDIEEIKESLAAYVDSSYDEDSSLPVARIAEPIDEDYLRQRSAAIVAVAKANPPFAHLLGQMARKGTQVMTNKKVKKIEATKPTLSAQYSTFTRKRKVAAYARVSTAKEEQENSFDAQVSYYTQKIQANPEWVFVEVYSEM